MEVSGQPHALMFCSATSTMEGRVDLGNGMDTRKDSKSSILHNFFGFCCRIARLCCGT
jgi:hypothetical protein